MVHAVTDQAGHRNQLQPMNSAELRELGNARHGSIFIHHFADDARGIEPRDSRQVHRGFGLSGANQNSAIAGSQSVDVAGTRQVFGPRMRIGGGQNRGGTIPGADARGRPAARVDGFAEGSAKCRRISRRDWLQIEGIAALLGKREADQAAPVFGHEIDGFGRDFFRRHGQIAFVFAVFVVHQDNHAALANFLDRLFYGRKWRIRIGHISPFKYTESLVCGQRNANAAVRQSRQSG